MWRGGGGGGGDDNGVVEIVASDVIEKAYLPRIDGVTHLRRGRLDG